MSGGRGEERVKDGSLAGGEHIPAFELYIRNEGAEDGEGHLRRRSPRPYESQVGPFPFPKTLD